MGPEAEPSRAANSIAQRGRPSGSTLGGGAEMLSGPRGVKINRSIYNTAERVSLPDQKHAGKATRADAGLSSSSKGSLLESLGAAIT